MNEKEFKLNTERIINISNFCDIKQNMNSFNETNFYIKSMNNSISSQKLRTQNSTCSSNLKSNKTFSNEENIISEIKKSKKKEINTLLDNLCLSKFSGNNTQTASNLKKIIYKKKQVSGACKIKRNKISMFNKRNELKKIKKINLINDEFSKKINNKQKKEFNDLTLDEYLKEEIKLIKIKNDTSFNNFNNTNNNNITNKENENILQQMNIINNQDKNKNKNDIPNKRNNKKNDKTILNNYITYNNYKFVSNKNSNKNKKNKISITQINNNSKKSCNELPKPNQICKNKVNSSMNNTGRIVKINLNKKNFSFLKHKKNNSFDGFYNETISPRINLNNSKIKKAKIVNLKIDLKDLININKENTHKKTFRFSRSSKKLNDNININNFTKDFFILPKLKKF